MGISGGSGVDEYDSTKMYQEFIHTDHHIPLPSVDIPKRKSKYI